MPQIGSRGGMSAQGFGMFAAMLKPLYPAGMFAVYYSGPNYIKYTYASDTTASYGVSGSAATTANKANCANVWEGLYTVGANTTTCQRLNWSQGTIATRTPGMTQGSQFAVGTGNATFGVLQVGTTGTNIYTYVANTLVVGTSFGTAFSNAAACSSPTFGLFGYGGVRTGAAAKLLSKYIYSSGAIVDATPYPVGVAAGAAVGNTTYGVLSVGQGAPTQSYKYTWASDVISAGSAMRQTTNAAGAWGNDVAGIFATNAANYTKYAYDTEVTTLVTSSVNTSQGAQGSTNGIPGVSY